MSLRRTDGGKERRWSRAWPSHVARPRRWGSTPASLAAGARGGHRRARRQWPSPHQLRRAIEQGQIVPCYQPVVSLWDGESVGAEALARWRHPEEGELSPAMFIPLAEETGLIDALGRAMLEQVGHDLATSLPARNATGWPFAVSVNVSGHQVRSGELAGVVGRLLDKERFEPCRLVLELTETALLAESEAVEEELHALSDLRVLLSLDDFGTGYSSLTQLERHRFDVVKIDRSFVTGMHDNRRRRQIVSCVVTLANGLGSIVVAEGVESEAEADVLRGLGVRRAQGYPYYAPMPLEQLQCRLCRRAYAGP